MKISFLQNPFYKPSNNVQNKQITFSSRAARDFFIISKDGTYKYRNDGMRKVASELNVSHQAIANCLDGKISTVKGYGFIDANGSCELSYDKYVKAITTLRQNMIYAISDDNIQLFESAKAAAEELKILPSSISHVLNENFKLGYGYTFEYANKMEDILPDKSIKIKNQVLAELFVKQRSRYWYTISSGAEIKLHKNLNEAKEYMSNVRLANESEKFTVIKASEIEEIDKDYNLSLNKEKVKEAIRDTRKFYIYAIDKNNNYTLYTSQVEAGNKTDSDKRSIANCLCGVRKTSKGNVYVFANNIEEIDDEFNISINPQKVKAAQLNRYRKA